MFLISFYDVHKVQIWRVSLASPCVLVDGSGVDGSGVCCCDVMARTSFVIYGLVCAECNKIVYAVETERSAGERINEHIADIKHKRDKAVSTHFNSENHSIRDLKVIILERCRRSRYYRKTRETYWIERLNTIAPHGANKQSQSIL